MLLHPNIMQQRQARPPIIVVTGDIQSIGANREEPVLGDLHLAVDERAQSRVPLLVGAVHLAEIPPVRVDVVVRVRPSVVRVFEGAANRHVCLAGGAQGVVHGEGERQEVRGVVGGAVAEPEKRGSRISSTLNTRRMGVNSHSPIMRLKLNPCRREIINARRGFERLALEQLLADRPRVGRV